MKVIYAVAWLQSEAGWGQSPEGYKLFVDLERCKEVTLEDAAQRGLGDPYFYVGPVKPLRCVEVPLESLDKELREELLNRGELYTEDNWTPPFSGMEHDI